MALSSQPLPTTRRAAAEIGATAQKSGRPGPAPAACRAARKIPARAGVDADVRPRCRQSRDHRHRLRQGRAPQDYAREGRDTTVAAQITMYSTPWCGYCKRLKGQMDRAGIEFAEVDIEQHPEAADFVMSVNNGNQTVPTVLFADGSALTNPSLAQVQAKITA
jgi:mycoredoxin